MNYRELTTDEVKTLVQQGCSADNWVHVKVSPDFMCQRVHQVRFTGHNRLGVFSKEISLNGVAPAHSGIYNAWLHNCTVGDNGLILNVGRYIANYEIADEVVICDTGCIETTGETTFGNGVWTNVIDEMGEHAIPLYNELSAQVAYLLAMNHHRPRLQERATEMIATYCEKIKSTVGKIEAGAQINGCGTITNVLVGERAQLENVLNLHNGSICSTAEAPAYVGSGCSCSDFIIQSGASLNNGVMLSHCLIGQGGQFDKQFSAEHSVFFANCQGFHSEACSVFAGPYTVTHHRSTLLIAFMASFMNAGSGSNQSNHAYKTGPVHYGLTSRGLKLASDSYVFWPATIGAYTMVTGRHYNHVDTTDFPFSYLIEKDGKSHLMPGINFAAIGTWRDATKWPQRDRRKGALIDKIHFDLLNPCVISQLQRGKERLVEAKTIFGKATIEAPAKQRGIKHYDFIETLYLLGELTKRVELKIDLAADNFSHTEWIDAAGMYCPATVFEKLLTDVESGYVKNLEDVAAAIDDIYHHYPRYAWAWASQAFEKKFGKHPAQLPDTEIQQYIAQFKEQEAQYNQQLQRDAEKDKELYE